MIFFRLNATAKTSKPKTMPDEFKEYLIAMKIDSSKRFDLERFRDCTESDRKECACLMINMVITLPDIMVQCANDARLIQCSHPPSNSRHTNFLTHFSVICETEMNEMFDGKPFNWSDMNVLGSFLGQLYTREVIKNATINKWFEHVKRLVAQKNNEAIQALLAVLKIVLDRMESRDNKNFKAYVSQLQSLTNNGQISTEHAQWTREILDEYASKPQRTQTQSPLLAPTQTTGAIRKT